MVRGLRLHESPHTHAKRRIPMPPMAVYAALFDEIPDYLVLQRVRAFAVETYVDSKLVVAEGWDDVQSGDSCARHSARWGTRCAHIQIKSVAVSVIRCGLAAAKGMRVAPGSKS